MDAFLNMRQRSFKMRFIQEQERSLQDFLEIASAKKHLTLRLLPGNHRYYAYKEPSHEYVRFTALQAARSLCFAFFSEEPAHGTLPEKSREHFQVLHLPRSREHTYRVWLTRAAC